MQKKYIWSLLAVLVVWWVFFVWNKNSQTVTSVTTWTGSIKKDFYIDIKDLKEFSTGTYLEKNGKITSTEEIKLNSQAVWRISKINVKEGNTVRAWQVLMSLSDNIASYGINLERARNALQRTQLSYDSTKLQLDQQIEQQVISLEKLNNSLATVKKNSAIDIAQIKNDVTDTNYNNLDSQSALQLQKLDSSISKADFDYQNALTSNQETVESFKTNLKNSYNSFDNFSQDIIDFWDKIFAITGKYDDELLKKYESYLWWKNKAQKDATRQALVDLIAYKKDVFEKINLTSLDEESLKSSLTNLTIGYDLWKKFLDSFEDTLILSIPSIGILSEAEISAYTSTINAYQSQLQAQNSAYTTFNNSAWTFLRTYRNNESSWKKQLDLLKQEREILLKTLTTTWTKTENTLEKTQTTYGDNISSLELQIKSIESALANSRDSRDISLLTLQNAIKEAQISYDSAAKEYAKLTITSPIDGIVWDILIDSGQDVVTGTPLVTILWNKKSEIEIMFKNEELSLVAVWDKVSFDLNEKAMIGTIYSITKVTDNNFNYKANVIFDTQLDTIGWVVKVKLPIKVKYQLLPMNIVTIIWNNAWFLSLYKDGKVEQREIILWDIYGEFVEFKWFKDVKENLTEAKVIISDVSNFDDSKFTLKISN